ncbi:MAG: hypothetical protein INR68_01895 [Methylobacterium mesophilicum]|nr:hypothetical protein [Methylobacterium mesophilicum]
MRHTATRAIAGSLFAVMLAALPAGQGYAQEAGDSVFAATTTGPSGLPLPRFVSLRSGKVNSRIGPGVNYPVDWMYLKAGMPMEIIQEYDNWRRIRDADGAEGWVNQGLLSGRRTGITAPWQRGKDVQIPVYASASKDAGKVALVDPGVVGSIKKCDGTWCEMIFAGREGYVVQSQIWGAYPGESVDE